MFKAGDTVELKSASQGWVKARVIDYLDVVKTVGGYMYGGGTERYKIKVLEGKHAGDVMEVPINYVRGASSSQKSSLPEAREYRTRRERGLG